MNPNAEKTNFQFYRTFKGSFRVSAGKTFKGSVELKIRFFGIWIYSEAFHDLRNLFCGFRKNLIFFRV